MRIIANAQRIYITLVLSEIIILNGVIEIVGQPIKNKSFIGGDGMSNLFNKDWDSTEAAHILMEDIEKNSTKESMEDAMIRAGNKAVITSHQLLDIFVQQGVMGVYHLGMKHMYEYLEK